MPFTQYRLLHDFGWEESGKNARQALKRTLLNLQEARWEGEVNDTATGKKTHEDHFGIIDRVLWPVVQDGRLERLGYIFLGSWFLEQLRHEAGVYIDWDVLRDLPPIARKLYGLLENDRFEEGDGRRGVAGLLARAPLLRQRGLDLRARARQRGRGGARLRGDRQPPRHRLPLQPRAGGDRRRLGAAAGGLAPGRPRRAAQPAPAGPRRRRLSGRAGRRPPVACSTDGDACVHACTRRLPARHASRRAATAAQEDITA